MKLLNLVVTLHTGLAVVSSTVVQTSDASISSRDESAFAEASLANPFDALLPRALEKRKGGGGSSSGGGGGGGRGGSSGSSGGRSGGSRGSTGSTGSRGSGGSTGSSG
jgi:hypothetical protein